MASIAVSHSQIMVTKGLFVDNYNHKDHEIISVEDKVKPQENDYITDIEISDNEELMALVTSTSKSLLIFDLSPIGKPKIFELPKTVSRIRFTPDNEKVLVADKNGDVLLYDTKSEEGGIKILGHLSLLLDVLQTTDGKYIISSDRDEKIKISCYPNTYNIHSYCLGHTEFVNHLELLPHDNEYLTSTSGDGTIKCWKYKEGKLCYNIDTAQDIHDTATLKEFTKTMDEEGVEISKLPIVHYAVTFIDVNTSILAVTLHNSKFILLYTLKTQNSIISHELTKKLALENVPAAIKFHKSMLYVYDDVAGTVIMFKTQSDNDHYNLSGKNKISMFPDNVSSNSLENTSKYIKALYKRKFDNVQEYLKRKMLRLEKKI